MIDSDVAVLEERLAAAEQRGVLAYRYAQAYGEVLRELTATGADYQERYIEQRERAEKAKRERIEYQEVVYATLAILDALEDRHVQQGTGLSIDEMGGAMWRIVECRKADSQRIADLEAALEAHGEHAADCDIWRWSLDAPTHFNDCNCGLQAALSGKGERRWTLEELEHDARRYQSHVASIEGGVVGGPLSFCHWLEAQEGK